MLRNDAGTICGNSVATTLYTYATPVPMAINVNMLVLRFTTEAHPRWKSDQPPQRTTGVARMSSSHGRHATGTPLTDRFQNSLRHNMLTMAIASKVPVRPKLIQN